MLGRSATSETTWARLADWLTDWAERGRIDCHWWENGSRHDDNKPPPTPPPTSPSPSPRSSLPSSDTFWSASSSPRFAPIATPYPRSEGGLRYCRFLYGRVVTELLRVETISAVILHGLDNSPAGNAIVGSPLAPQLDVGSESSPKEANPAYVVIHLQEPAEFRKKGM